MASAGGSVFNACDKDFEGGLHAITETEELVAQDRSPVKGVDIHLQFPEYMSRAMSSLPQP